MDEGICEHCSRHFPYRLIHNGFNDTAFAYCDRCGRTAFFGWYTEMSKKFKFGLGTLPPELEQHLLPCECGGRFKANAPPRCPHCTMPLSAELAAGYIERDAPGTAKGWRWQRSWAGLYANYYRWSACR